MNYSWQAAFLTFGLIIGVFSIPTAIFIVRAKPADMGLLPLGGEAALAGNPRPSRRG